MTDFGMKDINMTKVRVAGYHYVIQHLTKDGGWVNLDDTVSFDANIKIGLTGTNPVNDFSAIDQELARLISKKRRSKEFRIVRVIELEEVIETGITMDSANSLVNDSYQTMSNKTT